MANCACLIIKYANDDRYSNQDVCTHDKVMTAGLSATELSHIKTQAHKFNVIGIDEGQFFPDLVPFCEEMANAGKTVIVAALDGTFQRKVCSLVCATAAVYICPSVPSAAIWSDLKPCSPI